MQLTGIISLLVGPVLLAALLAGTFWGLAQVSLVLSLALLPPALGLVAIVAFLPDSKGFPPAAPDAARLQAIVVPLCAMAGLAEPKIEIHQSPYANSWINGFGDRPTLHVTLRLLDILDDHQLSAVIAHELSHVAQKDSALMSAVSAPMILMLMLGGSLDMYAVTNRWRVWPLLLIPVGVAIVCLGSICHAVAAVFSRTRELEADAGAARLTGDPAALASALIAIGGSADGIPSVDLRRAEAANLLHIMAVGHESRLFRSHPPLKRRLEQLSLIETRLQRGGAR